MQLPSIIRGRAALASVVLVLVLAICQQLDMGGSAFYCIQAFLTTLARVLNPAVSEVTPDYLHHDALFPDA